MPVSTFSRLLLLSTSKASSRSRRGYAVIANGTTVLEEVCIKERTEYKKHCLPQERPAILHKKG